jgi:circadian clock protein KaiC
MNAQVVVLDHIGDVAHAGTDRETGTMLMRLVDLLKTKQITALFTQLTKKDESTLDRSDLDISSLVDTWLFLRDIESSGERNRALYVLKSRGMAHSNQVREFLLTDHGVELVDVYVGTEGVLTGSARLAQEIRATAAESARAQSAESKRRERNRRREALEARISALRKEFEAAEEEFDAYDAEEAARMHSALESMQAMKKSRKADNGSAGTRNPGRERSAPRK